MLGNGVVGILAETINTWERRAPLSPSHCARLLRDGRVRRIIVQPSTKRIHHDSLYEDVGCEISEDISECGLIVGIKQPKLDMILPYRAYAFFSHTHKAQRENMPLLDKVLAERVSLYDYELIVSDDGKRMLAFGKYAGRAGLIDFLGGLGKRYLKLGYSTPFLSLGSSYMYPSLAAAKAAVIAVGEEISTLGLPSGISPVVFVFTGSGNVSQGAQEIFKLLPHTFVDPCELPNLLGLPGNVTHCSRKPRRSFQVYGCVVTCQHMVAPKEPSREFDKADYYAHPDHYSPIFHERIAPYASVIVNCMYWEKRFPCLLSTEQFKELYKRGSPLVGICDITCDIGGSIEFINRTTYLDWPFFRYNPSTNSYYDDMDGDGLICSAVDILPTEFAKEASKHFGDILSQFIGCLVSTKTISELPSHLRRACVAHQGAFTSLYEYIPRMRNSDSGELPNSGSGQPNRKKFTTLVSLSGHLFDQFLINEALDIIEAAGGSFHLVRCDVGQSANTMSYSELEVSADDSAILDQIIDSLGSLAHPSENGRVFNNDTNTLSLRFGRVDEDKEELNKKPAVLLLGAGRVCRPAVEFLTSIGNVTSRQWLKTSGSEELKDIKVIVASLYLKDAEEIVQGIPNAAAVQLDASDYESLCEHIKEVEVVISLLPPSCHTIIANACIKLRKHLVTASYVDDSMSKLDDKAKSAGVTILCEMGLDPGIDHMMAMKMIDQAHAKGGKVGSFTSYCGGLPSPAAANNPLAYKFSWNPAGAIRTGQNSAIYKSLGETIHIDGNELYNSAMKFRIPDLPAFALECLPNRNSLVYGDLYGISTEASTVFRATLRYEGFSEIMGSLAKIGLFNTEVHLLLKEGRRPTYGAFLNDLVENNTTKSKESRHPERSSEEKDIATRLVELGYCKASATAEKTAKAIRFLGLQENVEIPAACQSAFDITCSRMEERLSYSSSEQDMVLLHHEVEVEYSDGKPKESHRATLLEFGRTKNGKTTTAMALTVGIPAAIGALLMLGNNIVTKGVVRPLKPEIYNPALDILEAFGMKLLETVERD